MVGKKYYLDDVEQKKKIGVGWGTSRKKKLNKRTMIELRINIKFSVS